MRQQRVNVVKATTGECPIVAIAVEGKAGHPEFFIKESPICLADLEEEVRK